MFGNVLTNSLIEELIRNNEIKISPPYHERKKLKGYYYELSWTERILYQKNNEAGSFELTKGNPYVFEDKEYAIAELRESIELPQGIFGLFVPASSLIELGYGITAGKLDAGYGAQGERIRFGIFNLKDTKNQFYWNTPLAHLLFVDIRGMRLDPFDLDDLQLAKVSLQQIKNTLDAAKKIQDLLNKEVDWEEFGLKEQ